MPDSEKNVPRLLLTRKNNDIDMKAVEQKIKKMKNYILNINISFYISSLIFNPLSNFIFRIFFRKWGII